MLSGHRPMYELLFGDAALEDWPRDDSREDRAGEPWRAFVEARRKWREGDKEGAISGWRGIAKMKGIKSRHTAQAWRFLRQAGAGPGTEKGVAAPAGERGGEADALLGVVIEVTVNAGLDVLGAYPDGWAIHLNHAGPAAECDGTDERLKAMIEEVLVLGRKIVAETGVWAGERLGPAVGGMARVSMVTAGGLHFGQGPADVLKRDERAKPILEAGGRLMKAMMEKGRG